MRTLGKIALILALLIGGAVLWYMLAYPTYTYRYRMTVEVMVDGVLHSGSSVIAVQTQTQPQFLVPVPPFHSKVHGEAVFVDLGSRGHVYALLGSEDGKNIDYPYYLVPMLFGVKFEHRDLARISGLRDSREVPIGDLPTLVTFTNAHDPGTASVVSPYDFELVFGPQVKFKRAWVEITADSITRGIEKKSPWWNGPFPWLEPLSGGVFVDTRRTGFIWDKGMFKRDY